ncbi:MAG TPA: proton-conducting transporter membrane subunit [Noviherbaspirillum sp.]|uniref:complex I subunit 5 family protein n=1 Tax=Noviherbaspirillum sp. TaxID=1926288 RepID=UPI002D4E5C7D|nr:proton-conducting transporter membrane subunit [Noviherbaspirillum sp.]HYD96253.1 proton-conducting transporter membrane subunit [Noviherbaspirillum sp.]
MTWNGALPALVLCSSLLPGLIIFNLPEERRLLRTALNLAGAVLKLVLIGVMLWGVARGEQYQFRHAILPGLELVLHADALAMLFVTLSAVLWFFTTLYAISYLEGSPHRSRFFGFFSLCVTATVGVAMAGNLFTFFFFYELLTLSTYPLVVHRGTKSTLHAGNFYLAYTLAGGAVLLTGVVWIYGLLGRVEFVPGGSVSVLGPAYADQLRLVFVLLIAGVGVKAALVPLHGWLPRAMVAPAPVSALLHAVAVVKAGAFGVVRVVYEVFGVETAHDLGLLTPLAVLACATILWGSLRALFQDDLKRRLAYSTVSQVSYIVLGVALFGPIGTIGGLAHLVHQGIMKITLFFCAGNFAETLGVHKVSEMNGVGRRMPLTMAAFTIGALGMMGAPMTAGYVSKHYLSGGAEAAGAPWAAWVLLASSILNAAYFLPILYRAWFRRRDEAWPHEAIAARSWLETRALLLFPPLACTLAVLCAGMLSEQGWSPLSWAKLIAERQYLRLE